MHRQDKHFILKASSRVYQILGLRTVAIHIVHTILFNDSVGVSILHIRALAVR